ncbi:MAG: radical SAM protein [Nitrospirota bacterium]
MNTCMVCGQTSELISEGLNLCIECIREKPDKAIPYAERSHRKSREAFGLPPKHPDDINGIPCNICVNECRISADSLGFCGLRRNKDGRLTGVTPEEGKLSWYYDSLPTNCVADWVCAGGMGAGFPKYAYKDGPEYGYKNLAVFFHACSFDCLFCQNWHFRDETLKSARRKAEELANAVDRTTSCICYFGGDPTPQLPFALKASRLAIEKNKDRILRICWETNGTMNKGLLKEMIELSLNSGGCIKFDLKTWNENLNIALTGVTNRRTLENFAFVSESIKERTVPPLLVASTLLVPGYIDEKEIRGIARFIASLDKNIPYALLGFYPHFYMSDLPTTYRRDAQRYLEIAQEEGLIRVRIGNIHLLC